MIKNIAISGNIILIIIAMFLFGKEVANDFIDAISIFFLIGIIPAFSVACLRKQPKIIHKYSKEVVGFNLLILIAIVVYVIWPADISAQEFVKSFLYCILLSVPFVLNIFLIWKHKS